MKASSGRHLVYNLSKILLIFVAFTMVLVSLGELRAETKDADDFKVIVNEETGYTMLSRQEIADFYMKITLWRGGAEALPVVLPRNSPIHERFLRDILGKSVPEFEGYWYDQVFQGQVTPPEIMNTDEEVIEYVKNHPSAIGYIAKSTRAKGVIILEIVD